MNMGKSELMLHNIYIIVYVIITGLLSLLVDNKFIYLLWFFIGDDTALFIYTPFIFFFYQIYMKYNDRVYVSYLTLILNMIIMLIISYFIFLLTVSAVIELYLMNIKVNQ